MAARTAVPDAGALLVGLGPVQRSVRIKDPAALARIADAGTIVPVNTQRLASIRPGPPPGLRQPVRPSSVANRIGIPLALHLHDRLKEAVESHRRRNQNRQHPKHNNSSHYLSLCCPPILLRELTSVEFQIITKSASASRIDFRGTRLHHQKRQGHQEHHEQPGGMMKRMLSRKRTEETLLFVN